METSWNQTEEISADQQSKKDLSSGDHSILRQFTRQLRNLHLDQKDGRTCSLMYRQEDSSTCSSALCIHKWWRSVNEERKSDTSDRSSANLSHGAGLWWVTYGPKPPYYSPSSTNSGGVWNCLKVVVSHLSGQLWETTFSTRSKHSLRPTTSWYKKGDWCVLSLVGQGNLTLFRLDKKWNQSITSASWYGRQ